MAPRGQVATEAVMEAVVEGVVKAAEAETVAAAWMEVVGWVVGVKMVAMGTQCFATCK